MSRVHIFGLNHFLQNIRPLCETLPGQTDERSQKTAFRRALTSIIERNQVELIAEEAKLGEACLGQTLAREYGIVYVDITMPLDEREKRGIRTPEYALHPVTQATAYRQFEDYMFQQVKAQRFNTGLIMCGRRHFKSLEKLFKNSGDEVLVYDIYDCDWYQGIPQEGAEGIIGHDKYDAD